MQFRTPRFGFSRHSLCRITDSVDPLNYYAETKYTGEQAAKIADDVTVLRLSVVYDLASENFATWTLGELQEGNEITIVDDQTSAPTYAPDLARACIEVAKRDLMGLYHATGPSSMNRYEFTRTLARECDFYPDLVKSITSEKLGQKAPRAEDSTLDPSRLYKDIEFRFNPPEKTFAKIQTEL